LVALANLAITKVASAAAPANTPLTLPVRYTTRQWQWRSAGHYHGSLSITAVTLRRPQSRGPIGAGQVITWSNLSLPGDGGVGSSRSS